ncbi:MAG: hypothetical protein AAGA30_02655 [Planctomycetota bacterium]
MKSQDNQTSYLDSLAPPEKAKSEEYEAFSFGRVGNRTQTMVTFVKNDGYTEAIAYAKLDRIYSADVDKQLQLDFGDREVKIEGKNLKAIFEYVISFRCSEITESTPNIAMSFGNGEPVVESLRFVKQQLRTY